MHVSNQSSNFLPMEVTPWLCTRKGNVSFKKQCQDREQLILTIFNRLTIQCSEKKKNQCRSSQKKTAEAPCQQKQWERQNRTRENIYKVWEHKAYLPRSPPFRGSIRKYVHGERCYLSFISYRSNILKSTEVRFSFCDMWKREHHSSAAKRQKCPSCVLCQLSLLCSKKR